MAPRRVPTGPSREPLPSESILRDRLVLGILALGLLVRLLMQFPVYKYPADADALGSPATTLDVLAGNYPVFYSGVRLGALEAYLQAPLVAWLGPTRGAVTLIPILMGFLTLVAYAVFVGACLERRLARIALLFMALPPPNVLIWTSLPIGYPTTVLLGILVLVLAKTFTETGRPVVAAALGAVAGVGFWNSPQTLSCTLAAGIWVLLLRRRDAMRVRTLFVSVLAAVVGMSPWIAYNATHPLASFREGYGLRHASSLAAVLDNAAYVFRVQLGELLVGSDWLSPGSHGLSVSLRGPVLALYAGLLLLLGVSALFRFSKRGAGSPVLPAACIVLAGVALLSVVFFALSQAGQLREVTTVRYLLFAYLVVPVVLAFGTNTLRRFWPPLACAVLLTVALFNLATYDLPWSGPRKAWRDAVRDDERLLELLRQREVTAIVGGYWSVYSFNYLSGGGIRAVPVEADWDLRKQAERLPDEGGRLAVVDQDAARLAQCVSGAGLLGSRVSVGTYIVFFPERSLEWRSSPRELVTRLQTAYQKAVSPGR
jgi:hypothetical protein